LFFFRLSFLSPSVREKTHKEILFGEIFMAKKFNKTKFVVLKVEIDEGKRGILRNGMEWNARLDIEKAEKAMQLRRKARNA
jgi:hypothetical protein